MVNGAQQEPIIHWPDPASVWSTRNEAPIKQAAPDVAPVIEQAAPAVNVRRMRAAFDEEDADVQGKSLTILLLSGNTTRHNRTLLPRGLI